MEQTVLRSFIELGKQISRYLNADIVYLIKIFPQFQSQLELLKSVLTVKHLKIEKLIGEFFYLMKTYVGDEDWVKLKDETSGIDYIVDQVAKNQNMDIKPSLCLIPEETKHTLWKKLSKYITLLSKTHIPREYFRKPEDMYSEAVECFTKCMDPKIFSKVVDLLNSNKGKMMDDFKKQVLDPTISKDPKFANIIQSFCNKKAADMPPDMTNLTYDDYKGMWESMINFANNNPQMNHLVGQLGQLAPEQPKEEK